MIAVAFLAGLIDSQEFFFKYSSTNTTTTQESFIIEHHDAIEMIFFPCFCALNGGVTCFEVAPSVRFDSQLVALETGVESDQT